MNSSHKAQEIPTDLHGRPVGLLENVLNYHDAHRSAVMSKYYSSLEDLLHYAEVLSQKPHFTFVKVSEVPAGPRDDGVGSFVGRHV